MISSMKGEGSSVANLTNGVEIVNFRLIGGAERVRISI
jgi:hypothetical protein